MLAYWCAAHWGQKFLCIVVWSWCRMSSGNEEWKWELDKKNGKPEEKGLCWQTEVLVYKMEQENC